MNDVMGYVNGLTPLHALLLGAGLLFGLFVLVRVFRALRRPRIRVVSSDAREGARRGGGHGRRRRGRN